MAVAKYIEVISCCDGLIILNFKLPSGFNEAPDFYQYSGVSENGLVNDSCYSISTKTGTIGFVIGLPDVDAVDFTVRTGCDDDKCVCDTPCYTLYACDGSTFNTTTDLSANVGTYIRIEDDPKTWYVIEDPTKTTCDDAIDVVLDTVSVKTPCVLKCYQVTGNPATVTYMNADYDIITVIGATRVCSYIIPIVTGAGSGFVVELGLCVDGECPEICFEFTNCQTEEVLAVSNTPSVIPYYAQDQIVTLQGYEGCWSIDITEVCECPVSVTILTAYASCPACLPIVNYKFTNCNNQSIIRYSTEDYSAYVGKTVKLECGECWFVSEINYNPPSTQTINITFTFDSCVACAKTYYKLTNCLDDTQVIYTDSALNLLEPQISTFDTSPTVNNDCSNEFARVTYTYKGITYVKDLSDVGNINNENIYVYINNLDNNIFFLRYLSDTNLWTIFFEDDETAIVATSPDFINWTGENGYTNVSVNLITLSNPCITVVLDGIEYTLQSTGEEDGKSVYFYANTVGFDTFEVIILVFNPDTWYLNIGIEATQYQLNSNIDIPISTSWSFVEGTPFNTVSTIACNCEGFVVSIKECPGCWIVTETFTPINPTTVTQLKSYDDCVACQSVVPCVCTTIKNYDTLPHTYTYIDCNGIAQTITLTFNQESEKECIRNFVGDKLCNCITLTISGQSVTAVLQPNLVNGKPAWTFVYNTLTFNIVYDAIIGWKITNSTAPNPVATLGSPSIACPVGEWIINTNPAIDIAVFLDNGTLVLQGVLVYDYTLNLYTGDIEVEGTVYEFRLRVFYFNNCNGVWYLEYFNTDLPEPVWTEVAAFPANCTCLNGVYTNVEPTAFYVEIKGLCQLTTVDCSVGYEPFIPSATDDIKEYGDCINGACPAPVYPKRAIRPGYFVPSCDPDKYEKFACNSAEILYKTVLERRYGISNCCPDTDLGQRWIIKKELADLQGARDPNYICTPVQSCCNNTPTCGCGCNSTLKSCNSH
jgi:hypothetical protein